MFGDNLNTTYSWFEADTLCKINNATLRHTDPSELLQVENILLPFARKLGSDLQVWSRSCRSMSCDAWSISQTSGIAMSLSDTMKSSRVNSNVVLCIQGQDTLLKGHFHSKCSNNVNSTCMTDFSSSMGNNARYSFYLSFIQYIFCSPSFLFSLL